MNDVSSRLRLDLALVLPEVPDARDACVQRLLALLGEREGIAQAHVVAAQGDAPAQLCMHYLPEQWSLARVRELALAAGAQLAERYGHAALWLPAPLHARAARTLAARLAALRGVLQAQVAPTGALQLEVDRDALDAAALAAALDAAGVAAPTVAALVGAAGTVAPGAAPAARERAGAPAHDHGGGPFGERTELVFALVTGALVLAAWLSGPTGLSTALAAAAYVTGGWFTAREALENLRARRFEIDTLMLVAAAGAAALGQWVEGALLLFLFSLGHALEHWAMGRARRAIEALAELAPERALVQRGDRTEEVAVEALVAGDVVVVRPHERLPADGIVVGGHSSVNQAPVTGESVPVDKRAAADARALAACFERAPAEHRVFAGTINGAGALEVVVARPATDTTLARVVRLVTEAEAQRSPAQRLTERFERRFVPAVLVLTALLLLAWVVVDEPFSASFYRAMAVLVAASPCALAISVPSAVLAGVARAARSGVLVKGGAALENLGSLTAIAFDKTGTLTEGRPRLVDAVAADGVSPQELLRVALAVELRSDHPLAAAIVQGARERLEGAHAVAAADGVEGIVGHGVRAQLAGQEVLIGKPALFDAQPGSPLPERLRADNERLVEAGRTTMIVRHGARYLGVLGVMDTPRAAAPAVMRALRDAGIERLVMMSGDNQRVAEAVARAVGLTEARGDLLPEDKASAIRALRAASGKVAMVGDGVNDAPAMAHATVGIAMGAAGSDVALETADVALMADDLSKLPFAVRLSRAARSIIRQNLWVSLGVVALLIPATLAGLSIGAAVLVHEGSTLVVVANALRLLAYAPTRGGAD